ncbi:MAG: glycosyltransferase [Firmicutes bacterium]|nr:glycosyltransferase [Bacillota bacterium]
MNIWLLATEYPPYYGGGISTYTANTAHLLASQGNQVTVVIYDDNLKEKTKLVEENGIRVLRFGDKFPPLVENLGHPLRLAYGYAHYVSEQVRKDGLLPDVIEIQDYSGIGYMILQRKWTLDPLYSKIPVVVTAHGSKFILDRLDQGPVYRFPDFWIGEMERFCLKAADVVISPTKYVDGVLKQEFGALNTLVVPNPYDVKGTRMVKERGYGVLHLGRMQYVKGTLVVLQAMRSLWDTHWNVPLTIVGGDALYYAKNAWMSEYILEQYKTYVEQGMLILGGRQSPMQVVNSLASCQVAVIPSLFETFSYVAIEAMTMGRLVVASSTGGHSDFIENRVSGYIFQSGDCQDLANKLGEAINLDEIGRRSMVGAARRFVEDSLDPNQIYLLKIQAYQQAMEKIRTPAQQYPFLRPQPLARFSPKTPEAVNEQLSVVVPHYNLGKHLPETIFNLHRIKRVGTLDLEIIIVDDGSTDPYSLATLYSLHERYPYLKISRTKNQGLAATRNYGAHIAKGRYLAFLDADDMVSPQYYPRALEILRRYPNVGFVGCWLQYFGEADNLWPTWNTEPPYLLYHNTINSSALVYRRSEFLALAQNDPEMLYGMEDYESVVRLVAQGLSGVAIPEPWFFYRVRPESMSRAFNADNQQLLYRLIIEKNPDLYQKYATALLNLFNSNGPQYRIDDPSRYPEGI